MRKARIRNSVVCAISGNVFSSLQEHDFDIEVGTDLHSLQLAKAIADSYLNLRLLQYGQYYTKMVWKKSKCGVWQQSNELVLIVRLKIFIYFSSCSCSFLQRCFTLSIDFIPNRG